MHFKTKAVLRNLMSKGQQGYVNNNVSPCIGYISPEEIILEDPAWSYDSIIGVTALEGAYDDAILRIFTPEPLGTYDNRE